MVSSSRHHNRVLILYYSFSSQSKNLVQELATGIEEQGVDVTVERIRPVEPLRFPFGTFGRTFWMMLKTFFRCRIPIQPLPDNCYREHTLTILAGPTWSYNPSGPVLALLDRDGRRLFLGRQVIALISCRGYWRAHWWGLRRLLRQKGARVKNMIVFVHPMPEPWRTMGVFFKLAGRVPERMPLLAGHYHKYGHSREQMREASRFGRLIGQTLQLGGDLGSLDFQTFIACQKKQGKRTPG